MNFDTAKMAHARQRASKTRAGWLMGIAEGMFTVDDLLAAYPAEPALGRVRLTDLLAAQQGVSHAEAKRTVERFRRFAAHRWLNKTVPVPPKPTVAFLRHKQAGKPFRDAWTMATAGFPNPPWPGFPHQFPN